MRPRPYFEVIWRGEPSSDQAGLVRATSFCVPTPEKVPRVKMGLWHTQHIVLVYVTLSPMPCNLFAPIKNLSIWYGMIWSYSSPIAKITIKVCRHRRRITTTNPLGEWESVLFSLIPTPIWRVCIWSRSLSLFWDKSCVCVCRNTCTCACEHNFGVATNHGKFKVWLGTCV